MHILITRHAQSCAYMLKLLCDVPVGDRAMAAACNTIAGSCFLGMGLRVLLCIISAILDRLALLQVVVLTALYGCQSLLNLAGCQGHLNLHSHNRHFCMYAAAGSVRV